MLDSFGSVHYPVTTERSHIRRVLTLYFSHTPPAFLVSPIQASPRIPSEKSLQYDPVARVQ